MASSILPRLPVARASQASDTSQSLIHFFMPLGLAQVARGRLGARLAQQLLILPGVLQRALGGVHGVGDQQGADDLIQDLRVVWFASQHALAVLDDAPIVLGFDGRFDQRPLDFVAAGEFGIFREMLFQRADDNRPDCCRPRRRPGSTAGSFARQRW